MNDRKRRIAFRAWHRGTREMDFILGSYVDRQIATMDSVALDDLEALMEIDDQTLYRWIAETLKPPQEFETPLLAALRRVRLSGDDFNR